MSYKTIVFTKEEHRALGDVVSEMWKIAQDHPLQESLESCLDTLRPHLTSPERPLLDKLGYQLFGSTKTEDLKGDDL